MDKRRALRVKEEMSLTVTYAAPGGSRKALQVLSKDISATGMQLRTPDFVPVGTRLQVEVLLHTLQKMIQTLGVVRWVREADGLAMYEVGMEFENLSAENASVLRQFIQVRTGGQQDK